MQKIILAIIVFLAALGALVVFLILNAPQEKQPSPAPGVTEESKTDTIAFYESLKDRHPEGEEYVRILLEAQEKLNNENPDDDFSAMLETGVYLNLLEEKERAMEWYQKALEQDPSNLLALNNVANLHTDFGQYEKAEETWLKLIEAYPGNPSFYRSLGYLYRFQMQKPASEIEAFFQKGLEATNNSSDLLTWLLAYFEETGNNEKWVEYANILDDQKD